MLLRKNDISKVVTAAVGAGGLPDFLQQFREGSGLIYGIGPAISEYWTAHELYEAIKEVNNKYPSRLEDLCNFEEGYRSFCRGADIHQKNAGEYILARSNWFIQFKDELQIRILSKNRVAPSEKKLGMEFDTNKWRKTNPPTGAESLRHEQFFQRFAASGYAIERTSYDSVVKGIDKDWWRSARNIDNVGYHKYNITSMRQFMVRRACKFLLYDEISVRHGRIFYALDGLTLSDVAQRAHRALDRSRSKVPVCTSELREIFRMWAFLQNHVAFYLHLENSEPPWKLSDQEQWSAYAVERSKKVVVNDEEKTKKIARLSELHAKQQYDKVIDEYHGIPAHRLKRASLPFELRDDQEMDHGE